ncbi:hypothetical protein SEA_BIBWIT_54 [Gordonia phage Bibwit]|uniref:Uncharacterized protein n=3 Tax=Schenleyvirinae TaxID=3424859 RepID=A0A385DWH4_9CAUD|nr:hypothetical protein J1764_gp55 [Gordonia phage Ashertheman]YP_010001932.1 hypothetical protein J1765_gp54 [Gordonia phage Gaea]YP_010099214.1 hypothetical protein KNU18_gp54 [Gordonia phage Bibwit]AXQ62962.1 hypothetical protein SEA_ASHERTHEMAN_55 [Gordonia phage Ashertheman]AYR02607.1 hypothetical protein SEA_BIBWIT_54 [Gordonia phage Bibwit]AYR02862.1 hypothetical protein SEA_GAEA_54 [Gordonia phage Gaea]
MTAGDSAGAHRLLDELTDALTRDDPKPSHTGLLIRVLRAAIADPLMTVDEIVDDWIEDEDNRG